MNISTKKRLAFSLLAKDNGSNDTTMWNVHPSYSGVSLKWDKESGERYHTQSIDGTFMFKGSESEIITGRNLYTEFTLVIFDLDNGGSEVSRGTFRLTDCEIDLNHRSVKVKITAKNRYKKLNDKKDDEYNVVDLGLEKKTVKLWSYPVYQTYVLGDNNIVVSTRNGSNAFDCEVISDVRESTLGYNARFGGAAYIGYAQINNPGGASSDMYGFYSPTYQDLFGPIYCRMTNTHGYKIEVSYAASQKFSAVLYDNLGNVVASSYNPATEDEKLPKSLFMSHQDILFRISQGVYLYITIHLWEIHRRLLTNLKLPESGEAMGPISSSDFYPCNFKSAKAKTYYPSSIEIVMSTNVSDTDTGYGKVPNTNTWYDTPDHNNTWIPLYKESWYQGKSVWMRADVKVSSSDTNDYKAMVNIPDFYTLGDVIKGVLSRLDPSIIFETDIDHSRFLFDTFNPITQQQQGELLVSQKSNILNLQYDYPAWKAPVKMSQILTFLRNAFNCYYHIDENNHFHIEHVLYYMYGGNYSTEQRGTVDLTKWRDCGNKQKLSFLTNRWSYETNDSKQANRIEFGWMDTQSELFNGWPIIVPDAYRIYTEDKKEERKIDWFSTDIDFLTSVPAECSSDGFVIIRRSLTDTDFVEEGQFTVNGVTYTTQNVSLSFPVLHQSFMLYDLWSEYVTINNSDTLVAVRKLSPVRTAEVGFTKPSAMTVNTPHFILKTEAGNGEVESLSIDLTDMKITTTLKYLKY